MMIPSSLADLFRVVGEGGDCVYLQKKKGLVGPGEFI